MNSEFPGELRAKRQTLDRALSGAAVALTIAFAAGLTWWMADRAAVSDPDGMFGAQPTTDAATQGVVLQGPAPAAPPELANGGGVGVTTTGTITAVDGLLRTLTLDNGPEFALTDNMPIADFRQGDRVMVTYVAANERNVVVRIQRAAEAP